MTIIIIIINLLSWRVFPASGDWPVLSLLSASTLLYPLHPVAQLPSFPCPPLPCQSIVSLVCLSFFVLLFSTPTLSLSLPHHLFVQYVQTILIFSASNAPLNRPLTLLNTVLSTLSFNVTPQIILSILLSVARSL